MGNHVEHTPPNEQCVPHALGGIKFPRCRRQANDARAMDKVAPNHLKASIDPRSSDFPHGRLAVSLSLAKESIGRQQNVLYYVLKTVA